MFSHVAKTSRDKCYGKLKQSLTDQLTTTTTDNRKWYIIMSAKTKNIYIFAT